MSSSFRASLAAAALLGGLAGCFNGASAEGLPCQNNAQCGRGQECIANVCGGVAASDLCGNGVLDESVDEECDDGEGNADTAACKTDCTAQACGDGFKGENESCDDGNTANEDGCNSECVLESCGNGTMEPGEECDEGNANSDTGSCTTSCLQAQCGDGFAQASNSEDCDDAGESAACNDDCTAAACGDAKPNAAAGEECDNDSPAANDVDCMENCTTPILWDDMEPGTPEVEWGSAKVSGGMEVQDNWSVSVRNPHGASMRAWDSGSPASGAGDTRLFTPSLDLTEFAGESIELRFNHARTFSDCGQPTTPYEGAVIEVSIDGGAFEIVVPDDGYTEDVGDGLCMENPLEGMPAFTGDAIYATETVDLSAYGGESIEIGFRVGWDCGNCDADLSMKGWFIDNVVVWRN